MKPTVKAPIIFTRRSVWTWEITEVARPLIRACKITKSPADYKWYDDLEERLQSMEET